MTDHRNTEWFLRVGMLAELDRAEKALHEWNELQAQESIRWATKASDKQIEALRERQHKLKDVAANIINQFLDEMSDVSGCRVNAYRSNSNSNSLMEAIALARYAITNN